MAVKIKDKKKDEPLIPEGNLPVQTSAAMQGKQPIGVRVTDAGNYVVDVGGKKQRLSPEQYNAFMGMSGSAKSFPSGNLPGAFQAKKNLEALNAGNVGNITGISTPQKSLIQMALDAGMTQQEVTARLKAGTLTTGTIPGAETAPPGMPAALGDITIGSLEQLRDFQMNSEFQEQYNAPVWSKFHDSTSEGPLIQNQQFEAVMHAMALAFSTKVPVIGKYLRLLLSPEENHIKEGFTTVTAAVSDQITLFKSGAPTAPSYEQITQNIADAQARINRLHEMSKGKATWDLGYWEDYGLSFHEEVLKFQAALNLLQGQLELARGAMSIPNPQIF